MSALLRLSIVCVSILLCAGTAHAQASGTSSPQLHLRPLLTIGGDLTEAPYTFTRIGRIVEGPGGEIYVLDAGERGVKVFGSNGRFLRAFGRAGGGPGEFAVAGALEVDSVVRIFDPQARQVTEFTLDGRVREVKPLPQPGDLPLSTVHPLRGGGVLGIAAASFSLGGPSHRPNVTVLFSRGGAPPETVIEYHSGGTLWHPVDRMMPWGITESSFGTGGAVAVLGDSLVAVADGYSGQVRWFRPGDAGLTVVRQVRIPFNAPAVGETDLAEVERRFREGSSARGVGRITLVAPPRWSVASRALFADDGSLWIGSSVGAEPGQVWTVFPATGGPPRTTRLPRGFELRSVRGSRMYGMARTELDVQVVRVYEWRWE